MSGSTKDINIVKGKIANALTSAAKDHVVATTDDIYDEYFQEYQDEINRHVKEEIDEIKEEIPTLVLKITGNDVE